MGDFRRPFRTDLAFGYQYQPLRSWLLSGVPPAQPKIGITSQKSALRVGYSFSLNPLRGEIHRSEVDADLAAEDEGIVVLVGTAGVDHVLQVGLDEKGVAIEAEPVSEFDHGFMGLG
jgi:hypothetical protein